MGYVSGGGAEVSGGDTRSASTDGVLGQDTEGVVTPRREGDALDCPVSGRLRRLGRVPGVRLERHVVLDYVTGHWQLASILRRGSPVQLGYTVLAVSQNDVSGLAWHVYVTRRVSLIDTYMN